MQVNKKLLAKGTWIESVLLARRMSPLTYASMEDESKNCHPGFRFPGISFWGWRKASLSTNFFKRPGSQSVAEMLREGSLAFKPFLFSGFFISIGFKGFGGTGLGFQKGKHGFLFLDK